MPPAGAPPVLRLDHSVVHGIVGVNGPAEEAAVESLQLLRVFANDFEVSYRVRHFKPFFVNSSFPSLRRAQTGPQQENLSRGPFQRTARSWRQSRQCQDDGILLLTKRLRARERQPTPSATTLMSVKGPRLSQMSGT